MIIIDAHAHLNFNEFKDDLDEVLDRAKEVGVKAIICNGINKQSNREILELAKKHPIIKPSLGFYPCDCDKLELDEIQEEIEFIKKNNPIAIGEVGLDKKFDNDFEKQKIYFEKFINLAIELDIPIIVHSRKAEIECIEMLKAANAKKVIMHCFSGKKKLVQEVIDNGWHLSIPSNVIRSEQFQTMVDICPLRQLLTETDSPFMSPKKDVSRNEPSFLIDAIKKIAEIKKMDEIELGNIIFSNYQRLFL